MSNTFSQMLVGQICQTDYQGQTVYMIRINEGFLLLNSPHVLYDNSLQYNEHWKCNIIPSGTVITLTTEV